MDWENGAAEFGDYLIRLGLSWLFLTFLSFPVAAHAAQLVYLGPLEQLGTGLGHVSTVLSIGDRSVESGCVAWDGTQDIFGPGAPACPDEIAGGDEKEGASQTLTRTLADKDEQIAGIEHERVEGDPVRPDPGHRGQQRHRLPVVHGQPDPGAEQARHAPGQHEDAQERAGPRPERAQDREGRAQEVEEPRHVEADDEDDRHQGRDGQEKHR